MSKGRKKKRGDAPSVIKHGDAPPPSEPVSEPAAAPPPEPGRAGGIIPWVVFALCLLVFVVKPILMPPKVKEGYDYHAFGKLPVLLGGRIKPMDTVARTSLLQIAGQQRIAIEGNGPNKGEWGYLYDLHQASGGKGLYYRKFHQVTKRPKKLHPTEWLLEVLMEPDVADKRFIFRADHPELLGELQLVGLGIDKSGLSFYSFEQLQSFVMLLHKKKQVIGEKDAATRTPYERAAFKLAHALELYIQLRYSLQPNFLALSDRAGRLSGVADFAGDLELMRQSATELREFLAERKNKLPAGEPWPHIFAALEWREKTEDELKAWETTGTAFKRDLASEAALLGKLFFELDRSGGVDKSNLAPGQGAALAQEVSQSLGVLQERNQDSREFAQLNHVINDYLAVDATAQAIIARYLLRVEGPLQTMQDRSSLLMVPPAQRTDYAEGWVKAAEATLHDLGALGRAPESVRLFAKMSSAFDTQQSTQKISGDPAAFNQAVADLGIWMNKNGYVTETKKGREEHFFNTFAPFARAQGLYVIALLLACFSWLKMSRGLSNTAFYLIGLALLLHTAGLISRMYLEGRPPVTNLYSSAVFVGWGSVVLGWILERIYRNGIGSCVAALIGFSTLIIASHLSKEGDTMEMMRAVLDTNFWLATHVVCITIGYAATFLAGFLALIYVVRGVFTPSLEKDTAKSLARMVYGIVCFATLFSFVGTVLGGIWADQSWGRFWGWDSKENGALMIVVWNAIILHCRWGGIVRDRGLVGLAIFGNIVTAWSWFGVNMLGIGLHSYGFMDEAFHTLQWFGIGQVLLILIAAQPARHWLSGRHLDKEYNGTIAFIVAVIMGLGLALHVVSLWVGDFLSYLGVALVCSGLVLSLLPTGVTGTTANKPA
jgi:ABC-type transport system involved in cytochrome c biogenesis permease subunit